jgi:hypothetical protein
MQFFFAFVLTSATVIIHALATVDAFAHLSHVWQRRRAKERPLVSALQIVRVVSVLLLLHLLEAGVWAVFYVVAGVMPNLETAVYFSLTSYTTVGYGDVVLPVSWRFLGPIEAAVGILMFGWSTAIIVTTISRIYEGRFHLLNGPTSEEGEAQD